MPNPPVLYKYCPPERVDILEDLRVRFSPPSEFNDTFDTQYGSADNLKDSIPFNKFRSKSGILCLTATANDQLMWVHYARNHTGFIIGFDGRAEFFREDERQLGPVHYTERESIDVPQGQDLELSLCFFKSRDWEREREWRCVRRFESAESRLMSFDPSLIREIVIGHRADHSLIGQLVRYVSVFEMTNVQFYLSMPSRAQWRFTHIKKNYLLCQHCDGDGYIDSPN